MICEAHEGYLFVWLDNVSEIIFRKKLFFFNFYTAGFVLLLLNFIIYFTSYLIIICLISLVDLFIYSAVFCFLLENCYLFLKVFFLITVLLYSVFFLLASTVMDCSVFFFSLLSEHFHFVYFKLFYLI